MKKILFILATLITFCGKAQSIILDPRNTSDANFLNVGDFSLKKITTLSVAGTTYTTLNRNEASILKINGGTVHSINNGVNGMILYIINTGSTMLRLSHESNSNIVTTTPANRMLSPTTFDYLVSPNGGSVTLIYDGSGSPTPVNRWRILNIPTEPWNIFGQNSTNSTNFLGTTIPQSLNFKTNNLNAMTILSSGNVGIGTTTPSQKFHVSKGSSGVTLNAFVNYTAVFEDNSNQNVRLFAPESSKIRLRFEKPSGIISGFTLAENNDFLIYNNENNSFYANTDGTLKLGDINKTLRNIKFEQPIVYRYVSDPSCDDIIVGGCYPADLVKSNVLRVFSNNGGTITIFNLLPPDINKAHILHIFLEDTQSGGTTPKLIIKDNFTQAGVFPFYKIRTGDGGDLTINGNGGATLIYNPYEKAWFVVDWK